MDEVFNGDSILDLVLEGLTDDYVHAKYSAEADNDFALDHAVSSLKGFTCYYIIHILGSCPSDTTICVG